MSIGLMLDRKEQEAIFHNKRASDKKLLSDSEYQKKYPNHSFYSICSNSSLFFDQLIKANSGGALLDYCCGMGESSIKYSPYFNHITAIDISQEELEHGGVIPLIYLLIISFAKMLSIQTCFLEPLMSLSVLAFFIIWI